MRRTKASIAIAILGVAGVVAACGGSAATNPGGGAAATDPVGEVPSTDPGAGGGGTVPSVAVPSTEPAAGGGGGTAVDTCGLVTLAEMESIFGVSGATQDLLKGPPDSCDYQLEGAPFAATQWTTDAGAFVFDAMAGDSNSTPISGMGDRAVYNSQMRVLVVQVGDGILSIAAFAEGRTDEELFELMKQMGTIAAGRM